MTKKVRHSDKASPPVPLPRAPAADPIPVEDLSAADAEVLTQQLLVLALLLDATRSALSPGLELDRLDEAAEGLAEATVMARSLVVRLRAPSDTGELEPDEDAG